MLANEYIVLSTPFRLSIGADETATFDVFFNQRQRSKSDFQPAYRRFERVIGAGGLAPIAYGMIADHSNRTVGIMAAALTAAVTIPLILALQPILEKERSLSAEKQ